MLSTTQDNEGTTRTISQQKSIAGAGESQRARDKEVRGTRGSRGSEQVMEERDKGP